MPSKHPDRDELADLAADVLATRAARRVQAHVRDCEECCAVLRDAERIRDLLIADDPGPVPEDVWSRIEAALGAETEARSAGFVPAPGAISAGAGVDGPPQGGSAPGETFSLASVTVLPATPSADGGHTPGETHGATSLAPWAERRRNRESRLLPGSGWTSTRGGSVLTVAASVLALGGLAGIAGTVIAHLVPEEADTYAKSAPANLEPGVHENAARSAPPVATSGVNYTPNKIEKQVQGLLADVGKASRHTSAPSSSATTNPLGDASAQLSDPTALQQCLDALGASDVTPLAVDLARFRKREAAIIVLPGRDGGQEVWAVARDCRPGADGTMYYRLVKES